MSYHDRIGRFELPLSLIENGPHIAQRLCGQCVIIGATLDNARQTILYTAYHNQFDEIEKTDEIPQYAFTFNNLTGVWKVDGHIIEGEFKECANVS
jgi:hypothetical protein